LKEHTSTFVDPIKTQFKGVDVYEIPPNGQGITALLALNLLEQVLPSNETFDDHAKILHLQIEALRLAFADAKWYVSDLDVNAKLPIDALLGKKYAEERAKLINPSHVSCPLCILVYLAYILNHFFVCFS
jgi:gamma-glutamyltranspeptidase/glutathione hydrolase